MLNNTHPLTSYKMFHIKHIPGDGNCLFRAIAQGLSMGDHEHMVLRTAAVNYLRSNRQRFETYNDSGESWDEFIDHLGQEGQWAGERAIVALSELFSLNIFVHTPEHMDAPTTFLVKNPTQTIHLLYSNHNHYDLLIESVIEESPKVETADEPCGETSISVERDFSESTSSDSTVDTFSDEPGVEGSGVSRALVEEILFQGLTNEKDSKSTKSHQISLSEILSSQLKDEPTCRKWLIELGLLSESVRCPKCGNMMKCASPRKGHRIGFFQCNHCGMQQSLYADTIFANAHVPLHIFVQVIIRWFLNESGSVIRREAHVSNNTVIRIKRMMNLFATHIIETESVRIGGRLRVIEIFEALLHRRKYNMGRGKDPGWVLGGIERPISPKEVPRMFLVAIPNRKREMLQKMIVQWVNPGTIVVTDSFKAYKGLAELGFHHYSVNYKRHFVSPQTAAHTQRIEGAWSHIRKEALPLVGCRLHDVGFFLAAYLYRRARQGDIMAFLNDLKKASKQLIENYMSERLKIIPKKDSKQQPADDSPQKQENRKKVPSLREKKAMRLARHDLDETRTVLRQSLFTNSTALSQKEHTHNLNSKRESIPEKKETVAETPVEFDVVQNSQLCLAEIRSDGEVKEKPKTKQSKKQSRRSVPSAITTRSQTRKCSGRTPGFYAKRN